MASTPSYYIHSLCPMSIDRVLMCKQCHTHIASMDNFLSRAFNGAQSVKAGLFDDVSNVALGKREVWLMRTGAHTVRELHCIGCDTYLGWKILRAHDAPERWKDGAYVLERDFLLLHSVFEDEDYTSLSLSPTGSPKLKLKVIADLQQRRKKSLSPTPAPLPVPLS